MDAPKPRKIRKIRDYRMLRAKLHLSQSEFWERIGATQSSGSRYENKRLDIPDAVSTLAHRVYIMGDDIDVRDYQ